MSCDRLVLYFGFGLCLYFLFFYFLFCLFVSYFRECWNSFLLRLVPSHPRRASPRAHRVHRVHIERYSESSIVIALTTDDWEAQAFSLLPFTWVSAPAGRLPFIPIRMQLIPDCTRNLFSGWKIENAFFLFVECSVTPRLILCLSFPVSTHMAVSEVVCLPVFLSVFLSFCLSFSCHGSDNAFMCLCIRPPPLLISR